jgi:DNA polymerase III sliding clamp (beta) subunit (PCNA family)
VSLVAERGSAVRLSFGGGEVTIEAETQGRARAREIVRADFRGVEPGIAFSPHFLLDGIAAAGVTAATPAAPEPDVAGRETGSGTTAFPRGKPATAPAESLIRLEFNSSTKPAVITGFQLPAAGDDSAPAPARADAADPASSSFRYLVVPLRTAARQ